ncbi:glycerophosphodiester phosphodiesterase family protein [Falsigemmobacter faecalis]|uniref:Phosphodiesterase n=1 Tax=Falsigemmobacter faecalis TaxID=2488730 RepID=A0A3P3DI39_9RHOB|nr:glycerophosphodiester phosphodiesterase family protein [Falsigemmobacter faecalis]RRH73909.1 phosphodiesterase [Falsigemmobacter faecalis]
MPAPRLPERLKRLPVAHRALHDGTAACPENSMAAIRAAMAAGYAVELDLQISADNEVFVFHDEDLSRLTGTSGRVDETPAGRLSTLPLLGGAEHPPPLSDVLDLVAGSVPLLLEFKPQRDGGDRLAAAAAPLLRSYRGALAVMSFDPALVASLADHLPDVARGLTTMTWRGKDAEGLSPATRARLNAIADYETTGASFISHHHRDLGSAAVTRLRGLGADVLCWTIRSAAEEAKARQIACNVTFEGYRAALP